MKEIIVIGCPAPILSACEMAIREASHGATILVHCVENEKIEKNVFEQSIPFKIHQIEFEPFIREKDKYRSNLAWLKTKKRSKKRSKKRNR